MGPVGSLGNIGPLAPVNGGTAAASLSPLGQPTRVPPPSTGSFTAPNNYMGGAPSGQAYHPAAPYDSFSSVAPPTSSFDSGVAPTSFLEQTPNTFAPAASAPSLSPTLGGMRVIDMTQAPAPPGYQPAYQPQQYQAQPYQGSPSPLAQNPQSFYPNAQNFGGQSAAAGADQPPYNVAPQDYEANQNGYPMQTIQVPGPGEIALGNRGPRLQPNVGSGPSAIIANGSEYPMRPSVSEPSFQGGSRFPMSQPSTEPIDNRIEAPQENLPWRRPGTQF